MTETPQGVILPTMKVPRIQPLEGEVHVRFARDWRRIAARSAGTLLLLSLFGCSGGAVAPPAPPLNAGQVALAAHRASEIEAPYRIVFEWSLTEPSQRLRGRGVARIEPPYRVRLDLFVSNGERVAAAAMVGDRLVVSADAETQLPAAPLLWSALGVFLPGDAAGLLGGRWFGAGVAELRYLAVGGGELVYRLESDRVQRVEFLQGGRAREEVRLALAAGERFPREAVYRHLDEIRELRITLESVEHVEAYPSDIWDPGS